MTILIIEDEPLVALSLSRLIRELEPAALLEGPLASVQQSRLWLASHPPPDLIVADIQLSDGISLELFAEGLGSPIIFTTAYNEYAIRAFKVNSIDYLLKPVERSELAGALQKYHQLREKFSHAGYLQQAQELFSDFNGGKKFQDRFLVHAGRSVLMIPLAATAGFVKEELIYLLDREGKKYITDYRSLDEVQEVLEPARFFRANRQWLLQLDSIGAFRTEETGRIQLQLRIPQGPAVQISKERAAAFRSWLAP